MKEKSAYLEKVLPYIGGNSRFLQHWCSQTKRSDGSGGMRNV